MTIDEIAKQICTNLGFDPDEEVGGSIRDTLTPLELHQNERDAYTVVARWQFYRHEAALALAIHQSLKPKHPNQWTRK
jgi:hypothetical protein